VKLETANKVVNRMSEKDGKTRSANDQRSDVHNPTSSDYKAAADNRSNQMNPKHPAYHRSRRRK